MHSNGFLLSKALGLVLASALVLAACGQAQQDGGPASAPPPTVTVQAVHTEAVPLVTELPGRTAPYLIAEVRPQVTGIVQQRSFTEGSTVKAGELLYRIDPASYQAAYDSAKATLARAEANLYAARLRAERYAGLVKIEAVSKQANDDAAAALKQAQAEVGAAKAALDQARIDLDYTRVSAPIAGRIGRSAVTRGALVTANQPTALATVQQLDPIYVDLTQSSAELLALRRQLEGGSLSRVGGDEVAVRLMLEDGSEYAREGKLAFSEVTVDETTGSVTLRAVFPNPDGELLPGMYVRARIAQGVKDNAILVPHAAVSHDQRGKPFVLVVGADDKVEGRAIEVVQARATDWVVSAGLAAGERVIVAGVQKVRPGVTVRVEEAGSAPAPAAAPAAAAE